ncbi:hypothetical protein [uncultured Eudoraea sp.]|uniref:hypothetical protein n=1 Tax=uncultured Eudoraea sp. TaxID=1035614 RepID=UPI00262B19B1|nr:hypothetical protein [uncultured Eudoraea sp.]
MPHLLIKSPEVSLFLILPLILTSSTSMEEKPIEMFLSNEFYALNAEGTMKKDFENLKKRNSNISGQLSALRK